MSVIRFNGRRIVFVIVVIITVFFFSFVMPQWRATEVKSASIVKRMNDCVTAAQHDGASQAYLDSMHRTCWMRAQRAN